MLERVISSFRPFSKWMPEKYIPQQYLEQLIIERTGMKVAQGPFSGLEYVSEAAEGCYLPKLLGLYEKELHTVISQVPDLHPDSIIVIGAAEGYYAVGLATLVEDVSVYAFEMEEKGQRLLRRMAAMNGVTGRTTVMGKCEPGDLRRCLKDSTNEFILCDVEGYESDLLDVSMVPGLQHASILVELHEFVYEGIGQLIRSRFEETHIIEQIWQQPRSAQEFSYRTPWVMMMPSHHIESVLSERRPERMSWLWIQPRANLYG